MTGVQKAAVGALAAMAGSKVLRASSSGFESPERSAPEHQSCPADSPLSCSSGTSDTCCYEGTNGLFLSTQFWDYNPATGADDQFTLHGLWSDKCSGGYNQNCNPSWNVANASQTLEALGYTDLVAEMSEVWKNQGAADDELWTHEFNKHGTCMSTVNPDCYSSDAEKYQYVGDFFTTAVDLWKELPTYEFLTAAGFSPSSSETHTVAEFQEALSANFGGKEVYLGCDSSNSLQEVWYFFHLQGSVASGTFIPTDSITDSTCRDGFTWKPKSGGGGGGSNPPSTGGSKGYVNIAGRSGCLISNGHWYASGTCATYTVTETVGGVQLKTSKGDCGIVNGDLVCSSSTTASDFTMDDSGILSYGGSSEFSADSVPSGTQQATISTGSGSVSVQLQFASN